MNNLKHPETVRTPEAEPPVGEVVVVSEEMTVDKNGRPFIRRRVRVGDESDPETRQRFRERADAEEAALIDHPEWQAPHLDKDGELVIDPNNLAARRLYLDKKGLPTQMFEWGRQLKKAIALEGLQNLLKGGRFLSLKRLDERTLELFTNMLDGIGLRSRQRIYTKLLERRAEDADTEEIVVVSLGSGAAVPNIKATVAIERTGKKVKWILYDNDPEALDAAKQMIESSEIETPMFDFGPRAGEESEFEFEGRSYLAAREVEDGSLDAVDALGLWEYLTDNQAVTFLKTLYPKLKPGATMIVSNMLKDRPHPNYNQRAVGWPDLYMRSEEDLLRIVEKAGIATTNVRLTHAEDGVYVVMEIRMPGVQSDS